MASTQTRLPEIERLRAIAALGVVFVHWKFITPFLPPVLADPQSGVDLFFVISGFVVTMSFLRALPDLSSAPDFAGAFELARRAVRNFYVRRLFRILPAALTVMLLQRLLVDYFPNEFGSPVQWQVEVGSFLAGVYNFAVAAKITDKFSVYWSLSVEEQFYLFVPILFVALRTTSRRVAACAVVIFLVTFVFRPMGDTSADLSLYWYRIFSSQFRFDALMAGSALALLWPKSPLPPLLPKNFVRFGVVPIVTLLVLCIPRLLPEYVWQRAGFTATWVLSSVLVGLAASNQGYVFGFPVLGRLLEILGARSYALYLVHFSMMRLERSLDHLLPRYTTWITNPHTSPWAHFACLFAATMVVVELLHRLVERPFMNAGHALTKTQSQSSISPTVRWMVWGTGVAIASFCLKHPVVRILHGRDLADGAVVTASATAAGRIEQLTDGWVDEETPFVAKAASTDDPAPWISLQLRRPSRLSRVTIYNRGDGSWDSALPIDIEVSTDGKTYKSVGTARETFTSTAPCTTKLDEASISWVRVTGRRDSSLGLSEIEVNGE